MSAQKTYVLQQKGASICPSPTAATMTPSATTETFATELRPAATTNASRGKNSSVTTSVSALRTRATRAKVVCLNQSADVARQMLIATTSTSVPAMPVSNPPASACTSASQATATMVTSAPRTTRARTASASAVRLWIATTAVSVPRIRATRLPAVSIRLSQMVSRVLTILFAMAQKCARADSASPVWRSTATMWTSVPQTRATRRTAASIQPNRITTAMVHAASLTTVNRLRTLTSQTWTKTASAMSATRTKTVTAWTTPLTTVLQPQTPTSPIWTKTASATHATLSTPATFQPLDFQRGTTKYPRCASTVASWVTRWYASNASLPTTTAR